VVDVDPIAAMFNSAWPQQSLHMVLAAYVATGFAVAGLYAWGLLRGKNDAYHRAGLMVALAVGGLLAPLQPVSGDISARWVADHQPVKLAALEGLFQTGAGVPLSIGGWPDPATRQTDYAIRIPHLLSLLAYHDPNAVVRGLDEWPRTDQPDPRIVHLAFQIMVGVGTALAVLAIWFWLAAWRARRRNAPDDDFPALWLQRALVIAAPLGFVAIEAGWTVTEVGRQPWIVYGFLRTSEAVTPVPNQFIAFAGFTITYIVLALTVAWLLVRLGRTPVQIPTPPPGPPLPAPTEERRHALA
jgi:cytochrome d ubiquinol oxidase subunit I